MRLIVFGATGRIGLEIVQRALAADHRVTAVVRDTARLPVSDERLEVVEADPFDPAAIAPAVKDRDAVLSALGPRPGGPSTVCSQGAAAITEAMGRVGVRRLLVVSASGPYVDRGDDPLTRFVVKPLLSRVLREGFTDLRAAEKIVRASDLDWTILRPSRLTDGPAPRRIRRSRDRNLPFGLFTPRAAVAAEMIRVVDDPTAVRHSIALAKAF